MWDEHIFENRPMWDEHLTGRVNGELHTDDRLHKRNYYNHDQMMIVIIMIIIIMIT